MFPIPHLCTGMLWQKTSSYAPFLRAKVEDGAESRINGELGDLAARQAGADFIVAVQHLDLGSSGDGVEEDGNLDGAIGGAVKVVAVAAFDVSVESGLAALVAGVEDLEDVEFTTAAQPARALGLSVLEGARDLGVQDPGSGHVHVPASLARHGHVQLKEVNLALTIKPI